jgi:Aldehyde dehydrogenase family
LSLGARGGKDPVQAVDASACVRSGAGKLRFAEDPARAVAFGFVDGVLAFVEQGFDVRRRRGGDGLELASVDVVERIARGLDLGLVGVIDRVDQPGSSTARFAPTRRSAQAEIATVLVDPLFQGGCTLVKPAEEGSLSLLRVARIAQDCGLPGGALNVVTGAGTEAGAALAGHPGISQLTFTGSVGVGTLVMQSAARVVVPVTLELGGKCPNLVFPDAALDAAVPVLLNAIHQNAGQTCSAATRLIAAQSVHDELVSRLQDGMMSTHLAPGVEDPDMGPLISSEQLERVSGYVAVARKEGLELVTGGRVADEAERYGGFFYCPTLLDHVPPESRLAHEEVFGPVLAVLRSRTRTRR